MKRKAPARETNPAVLRRALLRAVERRIGADVVIDLSCLPDAVDVYVAKLQAFWRSFGRPFPEDKLVRLRDVVLNGLRAGNADSPDARLVMTFAGEPSPAPTLRYEARLFTQTIAERYETWIRERTPPLFGKYPDAKLVELARSLGEPSAVPLLDLGAGTGRNALALAEKGHPTTVVEPVRAFAEQIRRRGAAAGLELEVLEGWIESPALVLPRQRFRLAVMAEVATDFPGVPTLRTAFQKLSEAVVPGGLLLFNAFLLNGDRAAVDPLLRQVSRTKGASMFTRAELALVEREFPFEKVSDESSHDYEREHLPADGWPPTGWFERWAKALDVFDVPVAESPAELRWLVYRRTEGGAAPGDAGPSARRKAPSHGPRDDSLRSAALRALDRSIKSNGVVTLPCLPALLDEYVERLAGAWQALGKSFSSQERSNLREVLARGLDLGQNESPHSVMTVDYETHGPPDFTLTYNVRFSAETSAQQRAQWSSKRAHPLEATGPDAKVVDLAASLGIPGLVRVLDACAGGGRNALALAAMGHPTTAIGSDPDAARRLREVAAGDRVPLEVLEGDLGAPALALSSGRYKLAVLSGRVTQLRSAEALRVVFDRVAAALAVGGLVVFDAFVVDGGYEPDALAKQVAAAADSCLLGKAALEFLTRDLPFEEVSSEPALDYEQRRTPAGAWPPTGWFAEWAQARDVFFSLNGRAPAELRWLVYRRR